MSMYNVALIQTHSNWSIMTFYLIQSVFKIDFLIHMTCVFATAIKTLCVLPRITMNSVVSEVVKNCLEKEKAKKNDKR